MPYSEQIVYYALIAKEATLYPGYIVLFSMGHYCIDIAPNCKFDKHRPSAFNDERTDNQIFWLHLNRVAENAGRFIV